MAYQDLEPLAGPSSSKRPTRTQPRNEQLVVDPVIAVEAAATTTVNNASLSGITDSSASQSIDSILHNVNASTRVNTLDSTKPINPLQAISRFHTGIPTGIYALTGSANLRREYRGGRD
ncbi:hypothetical protein IFR04_002358 [Cadophora malorum]|uniref:Uncharacterized protein n=1 Tax=Cadophora malorum TaxID=108018 RepID=A0A8H7WGP6_9HELO|nr:hypothetical protein IFR04_002358 [Cadophora malorum]